MPSTTTLQRRRRCLLKRFILVAWCSHSHVKAFAPHRSLFNQSERPFLSRVAIDYAKGDGDNSPNTKKRKPNKKKGKKGTPRSKAKNGTGTGNQRQSSKTFVRKPPPLLADYQVNKAANWDEQEDRFRDETIASSCEHYEDCAGCTVGRNVANTGVVKAAQRYFASDRYDSGLVEDDELSYPVVIPSPTTGWRTQAKLAVANKSSSSWKSDGCVFGLFKKGSHKLLPIPSCVVHHPAINTAIAVLEQATSRAGVAAYSEDSRDGQLRYVQLQVERVTGNVCLTLVWNAASLKECQPGLARLVKALNKQNAGIWHSIWCHCNDGLGNNIFSRSPGRWHRLAGPEFLREPLPVGSPASLRDSAGWLYFTPLTFRQGNLDGFDVLALDVARAVPGGSKVCELYGGVGVLGLTTLAYHYGNGRPLEWLRCSDENPSNPRCFHRAVDSLPIDMTGRVNERQQKKTWYRGDKSSTQRDSGANGSGGECMTLGELAKLMDADEPSPFDSPKVPESTEKTSYLIATAAKALRSGQALGAQILIVDPPRKGLEDEVLEELCKPYDPDQAYVESATLLTIPDDKVNWTNDVQTLIYVSCGFDALARDCDRLLSSRGAGWTLRSSTGYILFPGSDHVETLAIFQRS